MVENVVSRSGLLMAHGRVDEAIALVGDECARGNPQAMLQNALWKLIGSPVPRDLPGARALLQRAAHLGDVDAALIEVALRGNGSGSPADWRGAYASLTQLARHNSIAATQVELLDRMSLQPDGEPDQTFPLVTISQRPNIWRAIKLFTADECRHIAQCAADLLQPATVVDPRTGQNIKNPVRTSDGAVIGPTRETLVVQALNRRLAAVTGTCVRQGEALSVLRYSRGQRFLPHLDAMPTTQNQRMKTVLVYLNDNFQGGCTYFNHIDLTIEPSVGDAIIFDNIGSDGEIDPTSLHAGDPVATGVKWLATRWIRKMPFDVWNGPEKPVS